MRRMLRRPLRPWLVPSVVFESGHGERLGKRPTPEYPDTISEAGSDGKYLSVIMAMSVLHPRGTNRLTEVVTEPNVVGHHCATAGSSRCHMSPRSLMVGVKSLDFFVSSLNFLSKL